MQWFNFGVKGLGVEVGVETAAGAGWAQMSSNRKSKGGGRAADPGDCEGGSALCGSPCKCTARCAAAFAWQQPITGGQSRDPEHTVRGRRGGSRTDEEANECEWNGGGRMVTGFFLFFKTLWGALATISDQNIFYWPMLKPMWWLGPISAFWCSTVRTDPSLMKSC